MSFYGHTKKDGNGSQMSQEHWQLLSNHLLNVANNAKKLAQPYGLGREAYLAGLMHDMGKYDPSFQNKVLHGLMPSGQYVNHSIQGATVLLGRQRLMEALCVQGHHMGMDIEQLKEQSSAFTNDFNAFAKISNLENTVDQIYDSFSKEFPLVEIPKADTSLKADFTTCLDTRFIESCIVESDYSDTEHFMNVNGFVDRSNVYRHFDPEFFLSKLLFHIRGMSKGGINDIRNLYLNECLQAALTMHGPIFNLWGELGIGKTMSVMAFALKLAARYGKKRIIYILPSTCIIDQTAEVFRGIFGEENVLEQHSALNVTESTSSKFKFLSQNWEAPIIVTTDVHFYETLFSNRPSRLRKLHNMADAIVISDEPYAMPVRLLSPTMATLFHMAKRYGTMAVFCSATQPKFSVIKGSIPNYMKSEEIIKKKSHYKKSIKRNTVKVFGDIDAGVTLDDVANNMKKSLCCLGIVNIKSHAHELYSQLRGSRNSYCLSTNLCSMHRKKVVREVKQKLLNNEDVLVASTQLVEAGVDVDFKNVMRNLAPLPSICQACGRANRECRHSFKDSIVEIFALKGQFSMNKKTNSYINFPDNEYAKLSKITLDIIKSGVDITSFKAMETYYKRYYSSSETDAKKIFDLSRGMDLKTIDESYDYIEQLSHPVIVPYESGVEVMRFLRDNGGWNWKVAGNREMLKKSWSYTVNIFPDQLKKHIANGSVIEINHDQGVYIWNGSYSEQTGISS